MSYSALVLRDAGDGKPRAAVEQLDDATLPEGAVTVKIEYSTLNYKDGLVLNGLGRLVRAYPHIGGIDFAGVVETSEAPDYRPGDRVVLTGWRVGELRWGGWAERTRIPAEWLVKLPDALSTRRAMAIGTAGFTAMLAVIALERHGLVAGDGEVLVTGAAGGVGGIATAILARLGHRVVASTGRPDEHAYLTGLGAARIIDRAELAGGPKRPVDSERWAGAIDSVGGATLAAILSQLRADASAAAVGLAGGSDLPASVLPFLLRGITLLGIDSVMAALPRRVEAWDRLVRDLPTDKLDAMTVTAGLADLPRLGDDILAGRVRGRVVVDLAQ